MSSIYGQCNLLFASQNVFWDVFTLGTGLKAGREHPACVFALSVCCLVKMRTVLMEDLETIAIPHAKLNREFNGEKPVLCYIDETGQLNI